MNIIFLEEYLIVFLVFLVIGVFMDGYNLRDYNWKTILDALFWPLSLCNVCGGMTRIIVDIIKNRSVAK